MFYAPKRYFITNYGERPESGFTVVELLLTIAVIGVLSALTVPYFNSYLSRNELKNETIKIVDALRRARGQAMAGQLDSRWGVHFESDKYVLFKGGSFSAGDPFNEQIDLPAVLTISVINLNGGGSDAFFATTTGETANFGTTTIQNDIGEFNDVVINRYGNVEIR